MACIHDNDTHYCDTCVENRVLTDSRVVELVEAANALQSVIDFRACGKDLADRLDRLRTALAAMEEG